MDPKEFDKLFRQNQEGFDKRPTNNAWERLENRLDQAEVKKTPKYRSLIRKYWAVAGVCLLFLLPATAWWVISQIQSSSKPTIQLTNKKPPQRQYRGGEDNKPQFQPAIQHSTDNNSRTNNRYEESLGEKEKPKVPARIKEDQPKENREIGFPKKPKEKEATQIPIEKKKEPIVPKEEKINDDPKIKKEEEPLLPKEPVLIKQEGVAQDASKIDSPTNAPKEPQKDSIEMAQEENATIDIKKIEVPDNKIAQWDNSAYSNAYIPAMPKYYWMIGEWKEQKKSHYWSWETISNGHVQGIEYSIGKSDTTILQICDIKETAMGVSLEQNDFRGKEERFVQYYKDMKSKKLIFVEASGDRLFMIEQGNKGQLWIDESKRKKRVLNKIQ